MDVFMEENQVHPRKKFLKLSKYESSKFLLHLQRKKKKRGKCFNVFFFNYRILENKNIG